MTTFQSQEYRPFSLLEGDRKQGRLCDFTLLVDGVCIVAHKVVLAATIPFFREVFLRGGECAEFEELKRLSSDMIEMIISFAYNGRLEITEANLGELLEVAKRLRIDRLKAPCAEYILTRLSLNSIHIVLRLAHNLAMEDIVEACMQSFANAFDACIDAKTICEVGEEDFCSLLTRPDLRIKGEVSLHRGIVCWLEHRSAAAKFRTSGQGTFELLASYPHLFGTICSLFLNVDTSIHFMHSSHELPFRLSPENIVPYLRISEELGFADVTALLDWTICKHFEEFSATAEFSKLSSSQLKRLLARDDLVVANEVTVLRSLAAWLNAQMLDRATRQSTFEDLFALIRLLQIPPNLLHDLPSEYSDCSTSVKCRKLIHQAQELTSACPTSVLRPEEASTATCSKKPRVYRDSGSSVLFVLSQLPFEGEKLLLVAYKMEQNTWNAVAPIVCNSNASVVGIGDSIYTLGESRGNKSWSVQIFTPATGERRQGSAAPEGQPCYNPVVFDKKILVASTVNRSSLYEPLSDTWFDGPGYKLNLMISCLISVRERHVLALSTRTKHPKAFCWSPLHVEPDAIESQVQAKNWTEMPFPECQPSDARGVEVNGRVFVAGLTFRGQRNQLVMFISVNDAHPDAWVPEGQWTVISELPFYSIKFNMVLASGDIYLIGDGTLSSNGRENAMVFLPAVVDRRPGRPSQSSSGDPISSWRWRPLAKFSSNVDYENGGVFLQPTHKNVTNNY
ncbi:Kelch-like protein 18 [Sparganum proliferum]